MKGRVERGVLEVRVPKPEERKPRKVGQYTVGDGSAAPKTMENSSESLQDYAGKPR